MLLDYSDLLTFHLPIDDSAHTGYPGADDQNQLSGHVLLKGRFDQGKESLLYAFTILMTIVFQVIR